MIIVIIIIIIIMVCVGKCVDGHRIVASIGKYSDISAVTLPSIVSLLEVVSFNIMKIDMYISYPVLEIYVFYSCFKHEPKGHEPKGLTNVSLVKFFFLPKPQKELTDGIIIF